MQVNYIDENYIIKEHFGLVPANYSDTLNFPVSKENKSTKSTIYEIPREYQKEID